VPAGRAGPSVVLTVRCACCQVLTGFIFSLFKAIVGSGILSLANSIARWTDNPSLIAPVCALSVREHCLCALISF